MANNEKLYQLLNYKKPSFPHFDDAFKNIVDSHLEYLKVAGGTRTEIIDNRYKGQFYGDFYAILNFFRIEPKYHRVIMLLNGLSNPIDYIGQFDTVFIPDTDIIDQILSVYNTGKKGLVTEPGE